MLKLQNDWAPSKITYVYVMPSFIPDILDQGSPNFFGWGPHWWFLKTRRAKRTKEFNVSKRSWI